MMASPGYISSRGISTRVASMADCLPPWWPGVYWARAASWASASKTATEKSLLSEKMGEWASFWTVMPISSTVDSRLLRMTSSVMGSTSGRDSEDIIRLLYCSITELRSGSSCHFERHTCHSDRLLHGILSDSEESLPRRGLPDRS